jgi:hypothetical protein
MRPAGLHVRLSPSLRALLFALALAAVGEAWLTASAGGGAALAQAPPDLLGRATRYVLDLLPALTNIVAEESYVQRTTSPHQTRQLQSDYLLVRVNDTNQWTAFRDVFSVDGKPVRDRDQRIERLFLNSPGTAFEQASRITREGSRHNLANIGTVNDPLITVAFLQPSYSSRFRFLSPRQDKSMGPDVWTIQYQEFVVPTILKGNANRDIPSRGRYWVDGESGRILKTELLLGTASARVGLVPIEIVTTFAWDEALKLSVPAEMRESYPDRNGLVTGVATYGRFRRFAVTVGEEIK